MTDADAVRRVGFALPRSYEVQVRGRWKLRVGQIVYVAFSADETTDVGYESGTTVSPEYDARTSRFTGTLHWVRLDTGEDDVPIDPEERLRVAMARQ